MIFKKLKETIEDFEYVAYLTVETNTSQPTIPKIKDAYNLINSNDMELPFFLQEEAEGYRSTYCKVYKNDIEFDFNTITVELKIGERHFFNGFIGKDYLILNYLLAGFDYSDNPVSASIFNNTKFTFYTFS